jgi:D-tyrosyl-tRNA(Tyr) deacylase
MSGWAPVGAVNHAKIKGERMRAVVQRVSQASVSVDGVCTGAIGPGLLVLACIESGDGEAELAWMARKLVQLRIFADAHGAMNRSLLDVDGELLAISQFTLAGDCRKGNRPSFVRAERPERAAPMFADWLHTLSVQLGKPVPSGVFGADMQVSLVNDGPVTLWLQSPGGEASRTS